ncbi:hypothetical protein IVB03_39480 [Bradyrhizobium sp. 168]|uniref:hypothetical protein n=1 Tax=Bradyrhizobium sp. 168 TaxID=2782639 RepID=UPI001FF8A5AE|nr:hypothetical protein [Bradyrhizobium sp. 168]MCK1585478.1 hypothetical protein [Bradyrhizobium sp. 168]
MASLFTPDVPQQDPAVAQQQKDEQARAQAANTRATQDQLTQETLLRSRRNGVRSLLGSFGSGTSLIGSS